MYLNALNSSVPLRFGHPFYKQIQMRNSTVLFILLGLCSLAVMTTVIDANYRIIDADSVLQHRAQLVNHLGLTDLALFTEARYTRHLSQSDLHSAFQDHPMALEHFPSGSIVSPIQRLQP